MESSEPPQGLFDRIDKRVCDSIWNDTESRFRTPVRLVFASAPFTAILIVLLIAKGTLAGVLPLEGLADGSVGRMTSTTGTQLYGALTLVGTLAVTSWLVDRRHLSVPNVGQMKRWGGDLAFGLVLGLLLQVGILVAGLATGSIAVTGTFTGMAGQMPVFWGLNLLVFFGCIGLLEEALFRWYLMRNLAEGMSWFDGVDRRFAVWGAIGLSAVAFSLWHTGSPVQFLVLAGCFGLFFGFAYAVTGSIALPVGVHTTWNFGEMGLFASETLPTDTMIQTTIADPVTMFGGFTLLDAFPFLAVLLATIVVIGWVRLRDGAGTFYDEIAVPSLHNRLNHRVLMAHLYPNRFDNSK